MEANSGNWIKTETPLLNNNTDYNNIYEDWKRTIELFNEYHKYSDNEYMKLRLRNS